MKKRKTKIIIFGLLFAMIVAVLQSFGTENYQAATSYTNAKEFYESTGLYGEKYHVETVNGTIYYATAGRKATSSSSLKYTCIGFDVELSAAGQILTFSVKNGQSLTQNRDARVETSTHIYQLYTISTESIYELAIAKEPAIADKIFSNSVIDIRMNAIMTTSQNGKAHGSIIEDGKGGVHEDGDVYHLADSSDLATMKQIFSGHTFGSYINIKEKMANNQLQLRYQVQGLNSTSSTSATVGNGFAVRDGYLTKDGKTYIQKQRIFQQTALLDQDTIGLQKSGYHLENEKEWTTDDGRIFSASVTYLPTDLDPIVGEKSHGLTLYANWQPNTYFVSYDANGGTGFVLPTDFTYDKAQVLGENIFQRTGYTLKSGAEWNTKADGSGTSYSSSQVVNNLTDADGETLTLYANWEPDVYTITLDRQDGTGGTSVIYEKYGVGFFHDRKCTQPCTTITIPSKTGHRFTGYYTSVLGAGTQIINSKGELLVNSTFFTSNETVYADFLPDEFTITFDKQGGKLGTDSIKAQYNSYFPSANAPVKSGYSFKGYYTQTGGKGTRHYNENMVSDDIYSYSNDLTLYAHWVDETAPAVVLKVSADTWTNQAVTLTAEASDHGSGLSALYIYRVADDGSLTLAAQNTACNKAAAVSLPYVNPSEGIIRYKAVATDMAGNTAEAYNVAYYDITPPKGETLSRSVSGTTVFFRVNITDVNIR